MLASDIDACTIVVADDNQQCRYAYIMICCSKHVLSIH
jgi:hypothetical protein